MSTTLLRKRRCATLLLACNECGVLASFDETFPMDVLGIYSCRMDRGTYGKLR